MVGFGVAAKDVADLWRENSPFGGLNQTLHCTMSLRKNSIFNPAQRFAFYENGCDLENSRRHVGAG